MRLLGALLAPFVVATAIGLVVLWPTGGPPGAPVDLGFDTELVDAEVVGVSDEPCALSQPEDELICRIADVRLGEGPDAGDTIALEIAESVTSVRLERGDRIVVARATGDDVPDDLRYSFADYQRSFPMLLLVGLFVAAVVGLGRLQGLRALGGVVISLAVLVRFVLPAILEGSNAVAVSLTGASVIMLVALYLAHGLNVPTTIAVVGTMASLALTGALAVVFVGATQITGLANEDARLLQITAGQISTAGLILGGIIIGTLGVLDDVTVTQVSAVWQLHDANPTMGSRRLYRSALAIGRDHIASTVNTLVLAYAGASLPLLLLFVEVERGLGDVLTGETVATEIVRTLVGSIGLVASVPITTALAVFTVTRSAS